MARPAVALWISLLALMWSNFALHLEVVVMVHFKRCVEAAALWSQVWEADPPSNGVGIQG